MKIFFRIAVIFLGVIILMELNTNSLFSDMKGFFHKSSDTLSFKNYSARDTGKIPGLYVQLLHLKNDSCKYSDTSQMYLNDATTNSIIGLTYEFVYKRKYYLQISELSNSFYTSLNSAVILYNNYPKPYYGYIESDDRSAVNYTRSVHPNKSIAAIYLKLLGKNTRAIIKNDTVACYYSSFTKFSIQYNTSDAPSEIFAETKGSNLFYTDLLPMEILFLKKDHKLYLFTMSLFQEGNNVAYKPGMLYNLINNKH